MSVALCIYFQYSLISCHIQSVHCTCNYELYSLKMFLFTTVLILYTTYRIFCTLVTMNELYNINFSVNIEHDIQLNIMYIFLSDLISIIKKYILFKHYLTKS